MASCALVGAASFNAQHFLKQNFDCIIAVDAGYEHLRTYDITPDFLIGDFDSLTYVPKHPHLMQFPQRKDESDIELALGAAIARGYDELIVYGCLGGRLDFTYAVCQLVAQCAEKGKKVFAVGEDTVLTALTGKGPRKLSFEKGAYGTLSLFAASEKVTGVDEIGLEYLLDKATLFNTKPLGISNTLIGTQAQLSVEEGTALVFFPVTAWDYAKIS